VNCGWITDGAEVLANRTLMQVR